MDHFISSVEKPFQVLLKSWGAIIFNFQWVALENASLRVYVGMMDDYGLCPSILHLIIISFWVNRACVSPPLSFFFMYFTSHLNPPQM